MDAVRLIRTARHAIAEARTVPDVLSEAWQAATLTEAVAALLGEEPSGEVAALAHLLGQAAGHAAGCLEASADPPEYGDWSPTGRASRLGGLGPPGPALKHLRRLLADVTEALVAIATGTVAQGVYWQAIDGIDAYAECRDLALELARALEQAVPTLVLTLTPPVTDPATGAVPPARRYRAPEPVAASGAPGRSAPDSPQASRPAPRPASAARSALTEASSSCICSSRPLGGVADAASAPELTGGAAGTSYLGSDMRGPLQLGGAR
ncbi:hypothetical protein GCM10009665_23700 [Kitasatospora nipponensis]|uniref:Uncharacterized protein n=1 Tax=Kitasatospora nipponensis TaxID=258049 RepID=A0ABP4GPD7_9ACTN